MTTALWRPAEAQMQLHVLSFAGPDPYAQATVMQLKLPEFWEP